MTPQENEIKKDIRILELMILKINKYFNKSVHISDLIYDLESLLNHLLEVDKKWKIDFRTLWLDIEVAYSLALDRGSETFDDKGKEITEQSLLDLKKMIDDKINELRK